MNRLETVAPQIPFEITTSVVTPVDGQLTSVLLTGRGWIDVDTIRQVGTENQLDVVWLDDETWQINLHVRPDESQVELQAIDLRGNLVGSDTVAIASDPLTRLQQVCTTGGDLGGFVRDVLNTQFGDANLDGIFDSSDIVQVFVAGEYEDELLGNSTWATGDWNCDGEFTTSDFVVALRG